MKENAGESADLKMALKRDEETPALTIEAQDFPQEAEEALAEVEDGHDFAVRGSWVANRTERGEIR